MTDKFQDCADGLTTPATKSEIVDISSTNHVFTNLPRGIWCGSAGALKCILTDDTTAIVFNGINAGTLLPFRPLQIVKVGTTIPSTDLIGLY